MPNINELTLAKELIKFPSVTQDAGAIGFRKKLKKLGFNCKILEFKDQNKKVSQLKIFMHD